MTIMSAVAAIMLGAGVIFALPDIRTNPKPLPPRPMFPKQTRPLDESLCEKQAWPYIDQRCAQRVEAARGTRQVRIVTDKGNSVTVMTPVPVVEAKPKPAPQSACRGPGRTADRAAGCAACAGAPR